MKILIADDEPIVRYLLELFLRKWNYDVVVAGDGAQAWQALQTENAPRLAILDWMMPGMDGVAICREIRKQAGQAYTYILLVTTKAQKQDIVEGLEAGADDYLTKPFESEELRVRLRAGRRILELQEQLITAREAQQFQATHDSLTGLWNRAGVLEMLKKDLARARREAGSVGVVLADLDYFKRVNDTYGHLAGDAVLREVAQRMRNSVRAYDSLGRYGGEEFLLILPGCNPPAVNQAERIRACVSRAPIDTPESPVTVTLSMGVANYQGAQQPDMDTLLRAADAALYRAKNAGRNRVEMATAAEFSSGKPQDPRTPLASEAQTR